MISMCAFKRKFFPEIAAATCPKPASNTSDPWCTYDNHLLTLVISSLYLSAFFACFVAADLARRFGRRVRVDLGLPTPYVTIFLGWQVEI